jgi:hypothetical protein
LAKRLFSIAVIQVFAELRRSQLFIVTDTLTDNRPQAVQNIGDSGIAGDRAWAPSCVGGASITAGPTRSNFTCRATIFNIGKHSAIPADIAEEHSIIKTLQ